MAIQLAFAANIPRRVVRRGSEFSKLKRKREDRLYQILMSRKVEQEHMRKMIYYVKCQEERQRKSREEEEARQREGNLYIIFNVWRTSSDFLSISLALPLILMDWLLVTWHYDFEEAERRRKEEAELKAKQDEIYEKQKQGEKQLEEKKRQQIEEVLGRSPAAAAAPARPTENPVVSRAAEAGLASSPTTGKYVPRFKRASRESAAPPPQPRPAEKNR